MATSGTTGFNLELVDIIEEAGERLTGTVYAATQQAVDDFCRNGLSIYQHIIGCCSNGKRLNRTRLKFNFAEFGYVTALDKSGTYPKDTGVAIIAEQFQHQHFLGGNLECQRVVDRPGNCAAGRIKAVDARTRMDLDQ